MEAYYTPNQKFYLKYETSVKENNNYKKCTGQNNHILLQHFNFREKRKKYKQIEILKFMKSS